MTHAHICLYLRKNLVTSIAKENLNVCCLMSVLVQQVISDEFTRCYDDVNICLWTDGSSLTQSAAQTSCRQRNGFFLPRVTNSNIQSKLVQFRSVARSLLEETGFWIDTKATGVSSFHWIDGSALAGQ